MNAGNRTMAPEAELELVLTQLAELHEVLLPVAREHREAISAADSARIERVMRRQAELLWRVEELDQRRSQLSRQIATSLAIDDPRAVAMPVLLSKMAEPYKHKLEKAAARLKALAVQLKKEYAVIREACKSLSAHLDALIRQVGAALSHAGVYSSSGAVATRVQVVSALDLTT